MNKKSFLLSKQESSQLTFEERQFAEEQFRLIYAQQMSKFTSEMEHQKKIQNNLDNIDAAEEKNLKDQYSKLKKKMADIESKRNKKLEEKIKVYKQSEERWANKQKEIQIKIKQQNREAMEKAQKYRIETQSYWRTKEKKLQDISRTVLQNSKTRRNDIEVLNKSFVEGASLKNHFPNPKEKRATVNAYLYHNSSFSQKREETDNQIRNHKQKSQSLQKEREMIIFQKAMQKMDKIIQNKIKMEKQKQSKVAEPTIPKNVHSLLSDSKRQSQKHRSQMNLSYQKSSNNTLSKLTKDHLKAKMKLEQQQFAERGQILELSIQKNRKDRILKMVRNKVQNMKANALMKEGGKVVI